MSAAIASGSLSAWEGYDYDIEVGKGNLVRGAGIEICHYGDGSYHQEEVLGGCGNEFETYDYETGEFNYYEME